MSWAIAAVMTLGLVMTTPWRTPAVKIAPAPQAESATPFVDQHGKPSIPEMISQSDQGLYQEIFRSQKRADWGQADTLIAMLGDRILLGHVMAERYLHRTYESKPAELATWLESYSDHPQAYDIYMLALAKMPSLKKELSPVRKPPMLLGYGDDNGPAWRSNDSPLAKAWRKGLTAWSKGDKKTAATLFSGIVNGKDNLPPGMLSASAYWSYRAYNATGNSSAAVKYLRKATEEPRTFYGILARKQLREPLNLDTTPISLSDSDILEMMGEPAIRRVVALSRSHLNERAEKELRTLFLQVDEKERRRLLALAHMLDLAPVQISMAKILSSDDQMLDFARYPIPRWEPQGGFIIDPALIYALARQESGFHAGAISPTGAMGIMQLMPATASFMKKNMGSSLASTTPQVPTATSETEMNVALGQNYIKHLLDNALVRNNLFYLLAAYNAGPGRLQEWKQKIGHDDDPLLFLESIPFAETRNYVMQVMANYWIYSEMAGFPSQSVHALLKGKWPSYDRNIPVATQMASARES